MSEQPASLRPHPNEDAAVGSKTRRRPRGKRAGRGPSQDTADTPAHQEPCNSLSSEGTATPSSQGSCNSLPESLSPEVTATSSPEEPYDPLRDVEPPETIPRYASEMWRSQMPEKVARDPCVSGWFDAKVNGMLDTTPITPWSLFHRGALINIVDEKETYADAALVLEHILRQEVREGTLRLVEYYNSDVDKAGRDTEKIAREFVKIDVSSATAAPDNPRPQESGAARRYRHAPRLFGCSICYAHLPSRRSLEKHFLTHDDKDDIKLAVCAACGFPAAHTTMLEWHVFVFHQDVGRMLVSRRWQRLRHKDHSGCSFCCNPDSGVPDAACLPSFL
ncbi:uncharacterized protein LOC135100293 [Scylla paramamosain]|uniref:uncharacterized protein LOC135100293 n=1 Tax=Scylla paramamosain TaxID=85552 RepID=UPI003083A973